MRPAVSTGASGPRLLPPHVAILALTAAAAVAAAWLGADGTGRLLPPDAATPEGLHWPIACQVFALAVAPALVAAWLLELPVALFCLLRGSSFARVVGRLVLATLPLAVLGAGHVLVNPWLVDLARRLVASQLGV